MAFGDSGMDTDLMTILSGNPWITMAQKLKNALDEEGSLVRGRFVLEQDEELVKIEEALLKDDYDYKLRLNFPPQPFIGNPRAKVWIVQFNPGYSKGVDEFDYLGEESNVTDTHGLGMASSLKERIELICSQYRLDDVGFYALDEKFHTFRYGTRNGCGLYLWYKSTYFPDNDGLFSCIGNEDERRKRFADDNLFVIEYFPYHTKKFRHEFFPFLPSFAFWRELMQYAFTHEKIVICNGLSNQQLLTACVLQSIPGYLEAKSNGFIWRINRNGKGRSRLMLKRDLVSPLEGDRAKLDDFLSSVSEAY